MLATTTHTLINAILHSARLMAILRGPKWLGKSHMSSVQRAASVPSRIFYSIPGKFSVKLLAKTPKFPCHLSQTSGQIQPRQEQKGHGATRTKSSHRCWYALTRTYRNISTAKRENKVLPSTLMYVKPRSEIVWIIEPSVNRTPQPTLSVS
ncbi:hypothetical protein PAXRUDRAFT_423218 [Paxillus rubicundulus Ve08.2h10]|uniref:Uncharacterized protein n=1 Tax=Paxillus rubicundulus Ve08.2h10 TaxID=930991 RepID=A0A0D0DWP6_9AGAM|nr:hypothetical protein PAXRUDRAFT_423218 [Paxillus rubicundulus Ve08.2h10]